MAQIKTGTSLKFSDVGAKVFIAEILQKIQEAQTVDALGLITECPEYGRQLAAAMPTDRYPRLGFRIAESEVEELKALGVISEDLQISRSLANGHATQGRVLSSLEKLLYSVLWKNGDLGKERYIVSGILAKGHHEKSGSVFYEFGGYLAGHHRYILDQHTLRCIAVHESIDDEVADARALEIIVGTNLQHVEWMKRYREFYAQATSNVLCDKVDFTYVMDRILFGAGKLVKSKKSKGN